MAAFKCKMCGGSLEIKEGMTICECEYCGSVQTVPHLDDEKKINLFSRANRLRSACEFDKAAGVYETIVADYPEEAEAYWGLLLCRFGIEYVDDPKTGKKIPTCHRSSFDSIMDDQDFEMVMEYSDPTSRAVYRDEAKAIEKLRISINEVSSKEEPYDIFICYKETDAAGERTIDSVIAQDVYAALVEKGYKVFFSRITLEDKLGQEYEPYIFAALNSAKVMLAFGTDYEYYNAVWVKNEWSRFLGLIEKGEKKTLIPCYKGIDAYDMPKEFAKLQAQDMGKVGALQDLIRGVEKILGGVKKESVVVEGDSKIEPLLKRAFMALEDEEWEKAKELCEQVLNRDPENAKAYLCMLMAEEEVNKQEKLADCSEPFDSSKDYQKALRFGDEALITTLRGYNEQIKERIEKRKNKKRFDDTYKLAVALMKKKKYKEAAEKFKMVAGYRNADKLAIQCDKEEKKIRPIVMALKTGGKVKKELSVKDKLSESKARVESLKNLREGFEELLVQASQLLQEKTTILSQEKDISAQIEYLSSREESLSAQRSKLWVFAGKGKKQIDEELAPIISKKRALSEDMSILSSRKQQIIYDIEMNRRQRSGCNSIEELDTLIEKERMTISELEAQIEKTRADNDFEYSYEEAFKAYMTEIEVTRAVNMVMYPKLDPDYIVFGQYIQELNTAPKPIQWKVLARENDRILVISLYVLECMPYNEISGKVTWQGCSLRRWLNESFLEGAFSPEEQNKVLPFEIVTGTNPKNDISARNDVVDKVFLLDTEEVEKYFSSDAARSCEVTAYCRGKYRQRRDCESFRESCSWWIRSIGIKSKYVGYSVSYVNSDGYIVADGWPTIRLFGVRPAMWIKV